MNECRSCGADAEFYLGKIKYNKPVGWYCDKCIENMPRESLKESAKLMQEGQKLDKEIKKNLESIGFKI